MSEDKHVNVSGGTFVSSAVGFGDVINNATPSSEVDELKVAVAKLLVLLDERGDAFRDVSDMSRELEHDKPRKHVLKALWAGVTQTVTTLAGPAATIAALITKLLS